MCTVRNNVALLLLRTVYFWCLPVLNELLSTMTLYNNVYGCLSVCMSVSVSFSVRANVLLLFELFYVCPLVYPMIPVIGTTFPHITIDFEATTRKYFLYGAHNT